MSSEMPQPASAATRTRVVFFIESLSFSDGRRAAGASPAAINGVHDLIDIGRMARPSVQIEIPADVGFEARLALHGGVAEPKQERSAIFQLPPVHLVASRVVGLGASLF